VLRTEEGRLNTQSCPFRARLPRTSQSGTLSRARTHTPARGPPPAAAMPQPSVPPACDRSRSPPPRSGSPGLPCCGRPPAGNSRRATITPMPPVWNVCSCLVVPHWRMLPHVPLRRLGMVGHDAAAAGGRVSGQVACRPPARRPKPRTGRAEARNQGGTVRCPSPRGGLKRESGVAAGPGTRKAWQDEGWSTLSRRGCLACAS
jgi:hypothetical protein